MRKSMLVSFVLMILLGLVPAVAQEAEEGAPPPRRFPGGPPSIDQRMAHLTLDLDLTPEQQAEVRPILEDHHEALEALRAELAPPREPEEREAMRERVEEIRAAFEDRMAQVLSEEQMARFLELRERHRRGPRRDFREPREGREF